MSRKRRSMGCFPTILSTIAVGVGVAVILRSCDEHVKNLKLPVPALAAQEAAADAEKQWGKEEAKQADRHELIMAFVDEGIFERVRLEDGRGTIWVGPRFRALAYDVKSDACSVVYAYVVVAGRDHGASVLIQDHQTGATVGRYRQRLGGPGLQMNKGW